MSQQKGKGDFWENILLDRVTGDILCRFDQPPGRGGSISSALSADNGTFVSFHSDPIRTKQGKSELYVWDISPVRKHAGRERRDLPADQWNKLWAKLGDDDPREAFKAMRRLAASPKQSLPLLKERLKPVIVEKVDIAALLAQLDGPFAQRQKAEDKLRAAGDDAIPFLDKAIKGKPSVEASRRMEAILKDLKDAWLPDVPTRRLLWSIELLEFVGTKEAQQILERLAEGTPTAWVTLEARKSLDRLKK